MAIKKGTSLISASDRKILKNLGTRVRLIREKKKLSVYDITGDDMPIKSRQHWQKIESGQKNVNITTIFKIAQSLEVSIYDLFQDFE